MTHYLKYHLILSDSFWQGVMQLAWMGQNIDEIDSVAPAIFSAF